MEVGKKYKLSESGVMSELPLYEVVYRDEDGALLKTINKNAFYVPKDRFEAYEEVSVPVTLTRYVNIFKNDGELFFGSNFWVREDDAKEVSRYKKSYVDTIAVTYTEK